MNDKAERKAKKAEHKSERKESKANLKFFKNIDKSVSDEVIEKAKQSLLLDNLQLKEAQSLSKGGMMLLEDSSSTLPFSLDQLTDNKNVYILSNAGVKTIHVDARTKYDHLNEESENDFRKNYVPLLIVTHYVFVGANNMSLNAAIAYKKFYVHLKDNLPRWLEYLGLNNGVWCERIVGILGNFATITRQRGDQDNSSSSSSKKDFDLCQEILDIDRIILDRYTLCCRQNLPDDSVQNEVDKQRQLLCLEGLTYKYLMLLFNLRYNVGSIGKTTAEDIHFVLRYEAKNAKNGSMVIDENDESDVDVRPLMERFSPRDPCNWLWTHIVLNYHREYLARNCSAATTHKINRKGISDVLDRGLTDKQVLDMYRRWNLINLHAEVTGTLDISSSSMAYKHKHYQKFMDDLGLQKKCCDHCGKQTKVLACSSCEKVFYCDRKCQKSDWNQHKSKCKK